jgi:hypothetical protein
MACKLLSKYFTDRINKKKQAIVLLLDEVISSILEDYFI